MEEKDKLEMTMLTYPFIAAASRKGRLRIARRFKLFSVALRGLPG